MHTIKWLLQCLAEWAEVIKADGNRLANSFYYLANGIYFSDQHKKTQHFFSSTSFSSLIPFADKNTVLSGEEITFVVQCLL